MLRERNNGGSDDQADAALGRSPDALLERPLSARSVIASLLLRTRPPRMSGARLVQWCGLFGVSEGTTRVALSRMVERGELRGADGVYELAGRVQGRRGAQDWSLDPVVAEWDGAWRVAVVAPGSRAAGDRAALRDAMRRLHYGALREGVWTRPDNLPRESAPAESWNVADAQCLWWSGSPDEPAAELATRLFEPGRWTRRAETLTTRLFEVAGALSQSDDGALPDAFAAGAAALAHIRLDPLLPPEIVGDSDATTGDVLRRAYRTYESEFSTALRAWFLDH
jgi:phenylacetic acid degradation operon negative regulatory protein